jgi:hypothetical protein
MISLRRRAITLFAVALAGAVTVAALPPAPGVTYRIRMVTTPPDMPGMTMGQTVIVGHGLAIGALNRLDIDTVTGQIPIAVGDFMLTLDSNRMVSVNPASKSYTEGVPGLTSLPPELLAQASVTNVNVTTEKLGAGEVIQGFATEKVRMTITYALGIMGQQMNTMSTVELSVAQLPATVSTPFDGTPPKEMMQGPMKELAEKTLAARNSLGKGTPLKTVTTTQITIPMMGQTLTTTTTVEILDVKATDVDPALLKIPEGFTKKP